jgi:hypothetical protein
MPEWLDTPGEVLSVLGIIAALFGVLSWLIRAQLRSMSELRPNGGSSLRDAVDRIESNTDTLHRRMDEHLRDHAKGPRDA